MTLPVIPSSIKIKSPMKNETFETVNFGDIKLIGIEGLKEIGLESFFPERVYAFDKNNGQYPANYYVKLIEKWKAARTPIRVVISKESMDFNRLMAVESFEYGVEDGSGDIYYSLELEEVREIALNRKKAKNVQNI